MAKAGTNGFDLSDAAVFVFTVEPAISKLIPNPAVSSRTWAWQYPDA
jgi:hypothetical protein